MSDSKLIPPTVTVKDKIHRIPVVDGNGRLQGLLTRSNILKMFSDAHAKKKRDH